MPDISSDILIGEVREAEGGIHSDLAMDLEEAANITARFPDNAEVTRKYEELRLATIGALKDLRIETSEQLREVQLSLTGGTDMNTLGDTGNISNEEKTRIQSLQVSLESEVSGGTLKNKNISELNVTEAETLLTLTHAEYGNFGSSFQDKLLLNTVGVSVSEYSGIDSSEKMNIFQQKLISKIFEENGNGTFEQGYTSQGLLVGFDSQKGNYTVSVEDFEAKIEAGEVLDRSTLSTYLLYKAEHASSPRAFMKEFSDTFGSRKDKVQNLLANGSDNMHVEKLLTLLSSETYQIPTGPETMIAFITDGSFSDSVFDFLGTAQSYISSGIENILAYLKNPETQGDTSETLLPLLGSMTQYISDVGDDAITAQLQAQLQGIFQNMLGDISNPDSLISRNLANTPLSRFEAGSELYETVLAAKTQEYQRELNTKLDSPELLEMREDMKHTLALRFDIEGISDEQLGRIFDAILQKIRDNPGNIESMESFQEVLNEENIEASEIGVEALHIMQELSDSYNEQVASEKIELLNQEIISLAQENPRNEEKIQIVLSAIQETGKTIDELRQNQTYLESISQLGTESLEYRLLSGELSQEVYQEQKTQVLTSLSEDVSQPEVSGESLAGGEVGGIGTEETLESIEKDAVETAQAILDAEDPEALKEAISDAEVLNDTTQGEASVNAQTKMIEVVATVDTPEAQAFTERLTNSVAENMRDPNIATSKYASEQVNTLRATLGEDNPLMLRITNAQEEGIQKAYEQETGKTTGSIPPLPTSARSFYSETITSLGLSESEVSTLTPAELKILKNSETARESFMDFRKTLTDLNLESIWQFRNQIFKAIGSLDFSIGDGDYIGANEMNIFLSKVMYATTGKDIYKDIPTNFQEIQSKIITENRLGIFSGVRDVSGVGDGGGVIENKFRQLFAPKDAGILTFNIAAFQEALSGKNTNS